MYKKALWSQKKLIPKSYSTWYALVDGDGECNSSEHSMMHSGQNELWSASPMNLNSLEY